MTTASKTQVGQLIRERRLERGLSLERVAAAAGVDPRWLSRLEKGRYQNPDARRLHHVAKVLDLETTDLFVAAEFSDGLPPFAPYLRSRYDLPPEAIAQLEAHFQLLTEKFSRGDGGPDARHHSESP